MEIENDIFSFYGFDYFSFFIINNRIFHYYYRKVVNGISEHFSLPEHDTQYLICMLTESNPLTIRFKRHCLHEYYFECPVGTTKCLVFFFFSLI